MLSSLVQSGYMAAQMAVEETQKPTFASDILDIPEAQSLWGWRKKEDED